jgi:hypothetical protein
VTGGRISYNWILYDEDKLTQATKLHLLLTMDNVNYVRGT